MIKGLSGKKYIKYMPKVERVTQMVALYVHISIASRRVVIEVQPLTFIPQQVMVLPAFTENVTFQIDSGLCFGPTFITTKYAVVLMFQQASTLQAYQVEVTNAM